MTIDPPRGLLLLALAALPAAPLAAQEPVPEILRTIRWDPAGAPFDVDAFLKLPPAETNAAALYPDALYEFASDVEVLFPEEVRARRTPVVKERMDRYVAVSDAIYGEDAGLDPRRIDALINEYSRGFTKLRAAQQRRVCTFDAGIGVTALLPHVQACRSVARIVDLHAPRAIAKGDADAAIEHLELLLRLSRDLRPRGYVVSQLVSIAMDSVASRSIVPAILRGDLTPAQCDRLMSVLQKHRQAPNVMHDGLKMEYVTMRSVLHDVHHRTGEFSPEFMREKLETGPGTSVGDLLEALGNTNAGARRELDRRLRENETDFFADEIKTLNRAFAQVDTALKQPYPEQQRLLKQVAEQVQQDTLVLAIVFPSLEACASAATRHQTSLAGAACLVAVRRWQAENREVRPEQFAEIVRAAGLDEIPADPFAATKAPMRLAMIDGKPVVYSVAKDGKDDGGRLDWKFTGPGDFLMQIEKVED